MSRLQDLSLADLRARAVHTFRQGGGSRPDVLLVRVDGQEAVLKDFSGSDPLFRRFVGPLSVRREARALRQLDGVPGVPRLLRVVTPLALLMEHVDGKSAQQIKPGDLPSAFFERFYALVAAIHARGVAHCDLRSRGNILLANDGTPHVVDFTAHFRQGRWWNPLARWAFGKFCEADRVAVARLKRSHAPELLTPEEEAALARDRKTPLERGARVVGRSIRDVARWLLTHKRR